MLAGHDHVLLTHCTVKAKVSSKLTLRTASSVDSDTTTEKIWMRPPNERLRCPLPRLQASSLISPRLPPGLSGS